MAFRWIAVTLLTFVTFSRCQDIPTLYYPSRPDIKAPLLHVMQYDAERVAPGYIFLTPNTPGHTNYSAGPHIYNHQGQLIWSGEHKLDPGFQAFNPQVVRLNDSDHFVFTEFRGHRGGGPSDMDSHSTVYNSSYDQVLRVSTNGTWRGYRLTEDLHEFHVVDGGKSALITSYVTFPENITYDRCQGAQTIFTKTGVFSEVLLDGSNDQIFQFSLSDHFDPRDSYVCPGDRLCGTGKDDVGAFDAFHINSIDKDVYGDYLVSLRHFHMIIKVAGMGSPSGMAPGEVIWRLGGRQNEFVMDSEVEGIPYLNFSFQHHARWYPEGEGFTFWDNANNEINPPSSTYSSGKTVRINEIDRIATLTQMYPSPYRLLDSSQGSMQTLPNGNRLLGMGSQPYLYESLADGTPVFHAHFGFLPHQSYRTYKFEWSATPPESQMGLFSYAKYCNASMVMYASWNGATDVAGWKYYTSPEQEGQFTLVAEKDYDNNFETVAVGSFNLWTYAEAYNAAGALLGRSKTVSTFVPITDLAENCSALICPHGTIYSHGNSTDCPAPPPREDLEPSNRLNKFMSEDFKLLEQERPKGYTKS